MKQFTEETPFNHETLAHDHCQEMFQLKVAVKAMDRSNYTCKTCTATFVVYYIHVVLNLGAIV